MLLSNLLGKQGDMGAQNYLFNKQELCHSMWQMPQNKCTAQVAYLSKKK